MVQFLFQLDQLRGLEGAFALLQGKERLELIDQSFVLGKFMLVRVIQLGVVLVDTVDYLDQDVLSQGD